jgi:hypothetical protein
MNRFFAPPKFLVAALFATAALGAASVAQAHPEVSFSVDVQSGPVWSQPARGYFLQPEPVYVQPRPIYVQPAPVYVRPPVFVSPRAVFEGPRWGGDRAGSEWERERAWRHAEWRRHQWREQFDRGDRAHEGDHHMRHHEYRD